MTELETAINYALAFDIRVLSLVPHTEEGVDAISSDFVVPAQYAHIVRGIIMTLY